MSHGLLRHTLAAFWLCMASASALAAGPPSPERFRLTPQLLERMEALQAASPEAARPGDDDEPDAQSGQEPLRPLRRGREAPRLELPDSTGSVPLQSG